ncbi:ATP synthase F1 subunit delta [Desulfurobacterium sp.]
MKTDVRTAKKYAKELVNKLSREELEEVHEELYEVASLFDEKAIKYLASPAVDKKEKFEFVKKILDKIDVTIELKEVLLEMAEKGDFHLIKLVEKEFKKYVDFILGRVQGELISTTKLDKETIKFVKQQVEKISGKKVGLEVVIDPSIIGGFIVKVGDRVIDASIKTQLENLKKELAE